jgi:hypothetical protein
MAADFRLLLRRQHVVVEEAVADMEVGDADVVKERFAIRVDHLTVFINGKFPGCETSLKGQ